MSGEPEKAKAAQAEHFDSWEDYQHFLARLSTDQNLRAFEQAADAIVSGDAAMLTELLNHYPALVKMRSLRNHHSTLLHYTGANGIEQYRQQTPKNVAAITELLLSRGAEADARADMYRGTTTLGLVATSVHPVNTGVQEALMEVLVQHGADPNKAVAPSYTEGMIILACIHNGRYEPVHWLARKGAKVDLEGACALGELETVKALFETAPGKKTIGLIWACIYGHEAVIDYLLERGVTANAESYGTTPLHAAAFGGQLAIVEKLINLGASMETLNEYGGTVLGTTLWSLYNARKPEHALIMELLIGRGAVIGDNLRPYVDEIRKNNQ